MHRLDTQFRAPTIYLILWRSLGNWDGKRSQSVILQPRQNRPLKLLKVSKNLQTLLAAKSLPERFG
jgi:hypothetical protein